MLYPQTGWTFCNAWNSPSLYPWTANMAKWHLLQITSMLHFNNNSDHDGIWRDSLHKVRPLLEIIKKALAWYATPGSEFSFDKATMACYSRYGRGQLSFNPKKPMGMFHFKIYMLCCAVTNLTYKFAFTQKMVLKSQKKMRRMMKNKIRRLIIDNGYVSIIVWDKSHCQHG